MICTAEAAHLGRCGTAMQKNSEEGDRLLTAVQCFSLGLLRGFSEGGDPFPNGREALFPKGLCCWVGP